MNPLASLSDDELVGEHSTRPTANHFLSEMLRRHKKGSADLGDMIWWLNLWLLVFTVAIFLLIGVLVWTAFRDRSEATRSAWVLWEDTFWPTNKISTEPVRAYTTKPDCDRALFDVLAEFTSGSGGTVRKDVKHQEAFVTIGDSVTGYRYVCLPDTVDPRGPKGK